MTPNESERADLGDRWTGQARERERQLIVAFIQRCSGSRGDDNTCDELVRAIEAGEHLPGGAS